MVYSWKNFLPAWGLLFKVTGSHMADLRHLCPGPGVQKITCWAVCMSPKCWRRRERWRSAPEAWRFSMGSDFSFSPPLSSLYSTHLPTPSGKLKNVYIIFFLFLVLFLFLFSFSLSLLFLYMRQNLIWDWECKREKEREIFDKVLPRRLFRFMVLICCKTFIYSDAKTLFENF